MCATEASGNVLVFLFNGARTVLKSIADHPPIPGFIPVSEG